MLLTRSGGDATGIDQRPLDRERALAAFGDDLAILGYRRFSDVRVTGDAVLGPAARFAGLVLVVRAGVVRPSAPVGVAEDDTSEDRHVDQVAFGIALLELGRLPIHHNRPRAFALRDERRNRDLLLNVGGSLRHLGGDMRRNCSAVKKQYVFCHRSHSLGFLMTTSHSRSTDTPGGRLGSGSPFSSLSFLCSSMYWEMKVTLIRFWSASKASSCAIHL